MTEPERIRISEYIENEFGIKMPASKKHLLEGRLAKRLFALGFHAYGDYFDFATRDPAGGEEFLHFSDLVSTHETSFFREPAHFDFLEGKVLSELCKDHDRHTISMLCMACSTGEEAWTLAMIADSALKKSRRNDISFSVEAVDLSEKAVLVAERGVYPSNRVGKIPGELQKRYLMVSKDRQLDRCRFVPELRERVAFHTGNLLGDFKLIQHQYDIVFCRNVLIYFDHANQQLVMKELYRYLDPKGFLFLGHSETLVGISSPLRAVAPAVYRKVR
jgi:chemotaxis protein methyltransferase CheR